MPDSKKLGGLKEEALSMLMSIGTLVDAQKS